MHAAAGGSPGMVELLLQHGADVNFGDSVSRNFMIIMDLTLYAELHSRA